MSLQRISFAEACAFSRAGEATFFGSNGLLQTAAAGVPRLDYDPVTLAPKGILIEGTRQNLATDSIYAANRPPVGPIASGVSLGVGGITFSAGVSAEVVATGNYGPFNYVDVRFFGTFTGSAVSIFTSGGAQYPVVVGSFYTTSIVAALVGGSLTNATLEMAVQEFNGPTFNNETVTAFVPVSAARQYQHARQIANATTTVIRTKAVIRASGAFDLTLRILAPQTELGAYASSPIPTTTMPISRSADSLYMTPEQFAPWYRQDAGTIGVLFRPTTNGVGPTGGPDYPRVWEIDSPGAPSDDIVLFVTSAGNVAATSITNGGVQQAVFNQPTALGTGALTRHAVGIAGNNIAASLNGGTPATDLTGTLPSPTRLTIGSSNAGAAGHLFGHIAEFLYFPQRLSNSDIQQVCA